MNTATQQVKQNIKKMAQQFANEPLEILKTARHQISPEDRGYEDKSNESKQQNTNPDLSQEESYKKQLAEQDGRRLEALQAEILDIQRQRIYKELLARIQSGEDVPIEDFQELSYDQREVLKAHLESVESRNSQQAASTPLVEPVSRKSRRMGGGQKQSAQKQTTRVEKPVPPSG